MKQHGTVVVTGSFGLLGSAIMRQLRERADCVWEIDNGAREKYFGPEGRVIDRWAAPARLVRSCDVSNADQVNASFSSAPKPITAVFHCAAQPAHDWSAVHPLEDFRVNALGTLHVLEAARRHCPEAPFVFASTSKVYGDTVNRLPLMIEGKRFALIGDHQTHRWGIREEMSIDSSMHSPYGAGKAAADLYVQEWGRYYGMKTACFRPGTITGPDHAAVELHGFLAYLVKCCATGRPYVVNGYGGYQVRDVIHADDLARAFCAVADDPPPAGEPFVTNFGGGLRSNCSMLEAIDMAQEATGKKLSWTYNHEPRRGDHMWFVGSCERFNRRYGPQMAPLLSPDHGMGAQTVVTRMGGNFVYQYTLPRIVAEIAERHETSTKESA